MPQRFCFVVSVFVLSDILFLCNLNPWNFDFWKQIIRKALIPDSDEILLVKVDSIELLGQPDLVKNSLICS